jgi:hypothetical protein
MPTMMFATALLVLVTAAPIAQPGAPTLRTVLATHRIDASRFSDADQTITSYAVANEDKWFGIAYYWHTGTDLLPPQLRLRTLDRSTGIWAYSEVGPEDRQGGSALRIARRPGVVYVDLHVSPSAGNILVLDERLEVRRQLSGWSSLILSDGRIIYENSMVHFAPAHPGSVSLYDPRLHRDVRLYPTRADEIVGLRWINRNIGTIEQVDTDRIRFTATEQDVRIGRNNEGVPVGPERRLSITCDVSTTPPACRARAIR